MMSNPVALKNFDVYLMACSIFWGISVEKYIDSYVKM